MKLDVEKIIAHYEHAKKKHPYFCDILLPDTVPQEVIDRKIAFMLARLRERIETFAHRNVLGWDDLLNCEVWEVFEALATGNKAQAIEEIYDCIAILLRTKDVLEGTQKLGKPDYTPRKTSARGWVQMMVEN